jgi:hypothetical protein
MNLSYKINFPWDSLTLFPEKIIEEIKIHTIREDKKDRWKAGRKIHHATGVRTKNYRCFREAVCTGTQTIEIVYFDFKIAQVIIDNKLYFKHGKNTTARQK